MKRISLVASVVVIGCGLLTSRGLAAEVVSGVSEFEELIRDPQRLKEVEPIFIEVKLGPQAEKEGAGLLDRATMEKSIRAALMGEVAVTTVKEESQSVLFAYVELASPPPTRPEAAIKLPMHAVSIKMQVWTRKKSIRAHGPRGHELVWRYPLFGTAWDDQLEKTIEKALANQGYALRDDIRTGKAAKPIVVALADGAEPTIVTRAITVFPGVGNLVSMQAGWIDESCRAHIGFNAGSSEAFARAVAKDFRFTLPGVDINSMLDGFAKVDGGWKALDRQRAAEAAAKGDFVIGGFPSVGARPGQVAIVVANLPGAAPGSLRAYWEGPGSSKEVHPITDIFGLAGPDIYFSRKISDN